MGSKSVTYRSLIFIIVKRIQSLGRAKKSGPTNPSKRLGFMVFGWSSGNSAPFQARYRSLDGRAFGAPMAIPFYSGAPVKDS